MEIHGWAAAKPGATLEPFRYVVDPPLANDCIVKVLACGICHSDIHMMDNDWQIAKYPLVPGHEVVGEVVEVGPAVQHLRPGDRVGVGWQRSACMSCSYCVSGNENLCDKNQGLIVTGRGGFADHLLVDSRFAFRLPDGLETSSAGPLLCGGVTVFSALHHAGMTSGQEIGVIGVGGLGHMAVQFASKLGNRVTVFTTSDDKAELADRLGAHQPLVVRPGEKPPAPRRKLQLLMSTVPHALDWLAYLEHLAPDGTLVFVASPPEPLSIPIFPLLVRRQRIMGSPIGGRAIMDRMLSVADRFGVAPMVELFPMERVNEAIQRVRDNRVRYRAVLTTA